MVCDKALPAQYVAALCMMAGIEDDTREYHKDIKCSQKKISDMSVRKTMQVWNY